MKQGDPRDNGPVIGEFLELACRAFMGGVAAALLLALTALALSMSAQAAPTVTLDEPKTGELLFHTDVAGRFVLAPRVETEVAIQVHGMVARTRVTQSFHNPADDFVEGLYVFPLPESAAVDRLWVRIGERMIEGQVREKEEARRTYEKARSEGRKAALVEQRRPNLFTNAVAHIGPKEVVRVTIEYQQSLAYENGEYRLRFPLAVTARYTPAATPSADIPDIAKAIEAEEHAGCGPQNPVDIAVSIDAGVPISSVKSSYHETWIEKESAGRTVVYLVKEQEEADRDFELSWSVAPSSAPQAAVFTERIGDHDYALLMVVPPQPSGAEKQALGRMPREMVLVADTSGSMAGAPLEQAKKALLYALETLGPQDRFNVLEFNSRTRPLFAEALPASPENVGRAADWVKALNSGGGTEMEAALGFALDGRDRPGLLRQVIFITDGGVNNEDALFALIAKRLGSSRLFTVGIGAAPNGHFMTKAAQFGRGTFTYIAEAREVEEKMARLFAKIEAPVLKDVSLRYADGTPVETFPPRVPDLYLGEPIVVTTAVPGAVGTVVVTGLRGDQPWSVALTPARGTSAPGVGALWARSKIATLMDAQRTGADPAAIRPQVVKVALEHHLVSAYTSLVAVDVTPTNPHGMLRTAMLRTPSPSSAHATLPQTDTAAALRFLIGLMALTSAAFAAVWLRDRRA